MPRLRASNSSVYTPAPASSSRPASARPSTASTSNAGATQAAASQTIPLPTYQEPSHPLTPDAQNKLAMLLNTYPSNKLHGQLKDASGSLMNHVDEINSLLRETQDDYQRRSAKRAREAESALEDESENIQLLQNKVQGMSERMETSVRKCIDAEAKIEAVKKSLREIQGNAQRSSTQATQTTAQVTQDGADNEENTQRPDPLMRSFEGSVEKHTDIYMAKPPKFRYKEHDWFRNFKQAEYYASHGDDAKRPDENRWFDNDGEPQAGVTGGIDDDDFEEMGERISTKCPLTLRDFEDPVTSKKCPHSFEKKAIQEFIKQNRPPTRGRGPAPVQDIECPVPGCEHRLTLDDLTEDVRLKTLIKRKLRRQELARQQAEEDEDEVRRETRDGTRVESIESGDEVDDSDSVERRAGPSSMASVKRERRTQDMIVDDEDED